MITCAQNIKIAIANGSGYRFKQLTELFAGNGMIGYVAKERVDGKLILPEAVQILTITGSAKAAKA